MNAIVKFVKDMFAIGETARAENWRNEVIDQAGLSMDNTVRPLGKPDDYVFEDEFETLEQMKAKFDD